MFKANIEIGSLNEVLKDTCSHLGPGVELENAEVEVPANRFHHTSSSNALTPTPKFLSKSESEEPELKSQAECAVCDLSQGHECEEEFDNFQRSFHTLLRQHGFFKVRQLQNYYFYWSKVASQLPYHHLSDSTDLLTVAMENYESSVPVDATHHTATDTLPVQSAPPEERRKNLKGKR